MNSSEMEIGVFETRMVGSFLKVHSKKPNLLLQKNKHTSDCNAWAYCVRIAIAANPFNEFYEYLNTL